MAVHPARQHAAGALPERVTGGQARSGSRLHRAGMIAPAPGAAAAAAPSA
jgi:hypothetical protein